MDAEELRQRIAESVDFPAKYLGDGTEPFREQQEALGRHFEPIRQHHEKVWLPFFKWLDGLFS